MASIFNDMEDINKRVRQDGRILYVDPNNVYDTINGIPLTPDYTDLCISFDLEVETVPRTGYVLSKKQDEAAKEATETYHITWTSYQSDTNPDDNKVSFTKGEDYLGTNYLTTYYTDINLNDFRNKDIVEGLGVESVNVTFESYYTPTIKIRFIDTRGASLFGRQEATHLDNKVTQDSIWGCFFTFPYPKFRLQIKGFYGHAVTYQLTCTDFRANFNSKTGNFDIDVTFLGYDYGILADIPTAYLLAAPYSKYVGEQYWKDHESSEEWRLADGNKPEKLFHIAYKIRSSMRSIDTDKNGTTVSDGDNGADYADRVAEGYVLKDVVNAYNGIVSAITTAQIPAMYIIDNVYRFNYDEKLYYMINAQGSDYWEFLKGKCDAFYEIVDKFRQDYQHDGTLLNTENLVFYGDTREKTVFSVPLDPLNLTQTVQKWRLSPTSYIKEVGTNFVEDKPEAINFNAVKDFCRYKNGECYEVLLDYSKEYQIIPLGKTEQILKDLSNQLSAYKDTEDEKAIGEQDNTDSYESRLSIYQLAGLTPTIENVFKTIMCHLETFIAMVYECKKNIDFQITDGKRTPEKLGVQGYSFQDLKTGDASNTMNTNLPPWVAISVDEPKGETGNAVHDSVRTIGWVGSFEGETEWEEAKLIEGLSLAWKKNAPKDDTIKTVYNSPASLTCLPSDVFTDVFPEAAIKNPYSLGEYMGIRAAALFGVVGYDSKAADAIGKADAINLYSKIGKEEIKTRFLNRKDEWKKVVKSAPTMINPTDNPNYEREYTINPGCEKPNMLILTKDGSKYRYSYTESVLGRNTSKPEKYGMVPVVEGNVNTVMGGENSAATFYTNVPQDANPKTRDVKAQYINGANGQVGRIYHRMTTEAFRQKNGLEETYNQQPYQNDAMFNIFSPTSENAQSIEEQSLKLKGEKLTVGEYDDTDNTWRKTLSSYWKVDDASQYMQPKSQLEQYRWTVAVGTKAHEYVNIFDSKLYYAQNKRSGAEEMNIFEIEASKALLFLSTACYDFNTAMSAFKYQTHASVLEKVPYGALLLIGGQLWRAKLDREPLKFPQGYKHFTYSDTNGKKYSTISNVDYTAVATNKKYGTSMDIFYHAETNKHPGLELLSTDGTYNQFQINPSDFDENITNRLIKEFKHFVNNEWGNIRRDNEHFDNGMAYTDETIYKFFEKKENVKWIDDGRSSKNLNANTDVAGLDAGAIISRGTLRNQYTDTEGTVTFDTAVWENYADSFCNKLEEIANYEKKLAGDKPPMKEVNKEKDLKLAMYMYIKRLWDRWFMMGNPEDFKVQNYMKHFVFMDSFYRNIGSMLHINCEKLLTSLDNVGGESMLFQLLADITTDHHCNFFGLPDYFGYGDDEHSQVNAVNPELDSVHKIADMFKPIPYSKKEKLETSNKFIVMLTYDQSENISDFNGYMNDDFDIFSHDGSDIVRPETFNTAAIDMEKLRDVPSEARRVRRYGYNIPSFGVTFGRQENAIFKTVNIGMSNPIATEQSINALSVIADKGGGNDKAICYYGQDLFPVYNGYSYECAVEMMGDAQIMPLMYFQLLNIPMFRGTYMIYSVTHSMRPGDMTTTFKGIKLSRFALPFAQGWYIASENGQGFYIGSDGQFIGGNTLDEHGCDINLKLHRVVKSDTYTEGKLYINGDYFCDTLEDTDRGLNMSMSLSEIQSAKIKGITAIPYGQYGVTIDKQSPRLSKRKFYQDVCQGNVPRLLKVKGFDGILIHAGSTKDDTEGCILVGIKDKDGHIANSRDKFKQLYDYLASRKTEDNTIQISIV